ncbi:MAG: hypothetical protein IPH20_15975 [Bacteroidales bacterium]|nr:hypothetical protein [Bacteroidales bacterium]
MIRSFLLILLMLAPGLAPAQKVSLNLARETYFGMSADECNALRLSNDFEKSPPTDAVLKAYYGASTAAAPACLGSPAKKISYFRKGKELIAEAVKLQPDNFEIRFLRFATQSKTPSFLGYHQNIDEDKLFLLANLEKGRAAVANSRIFAKMTDFLATSERLTVKEQAKVRQLNKIAEK